MVNDKSERFERFIEERFERSDWDGYISRDKCKLLRRKIFEACHFPRSTLYQNVVIKKRLDDVEFELRRRGLLSGSNQMTTREMDEPDVIAVAAELGSRLNNLSDRMTLLLASIEEARCKARTFGKE